MDNFVGADAIKLLTRYQEIPEKTRNDYTKTIKTVADQIWPEQQPKIIYEIHQPTTAAHVLH